LGSKVGHKETKSSNIAMLFIKFQLMELHLQFNKFFLIVKIK
jgi:hypothetical protein